MTGATHLIVGLTTAGYLGFTEPKQLIVAGIASLLPDIDKQNSLLGRFIPILPTVIEKTFGHRTITHTVFFMGLVIGFFYPFQPP